MIQKIIRFDKKKLYMKSYIITNGLVKFAHLSFGYVGGEKMAHEKKGQNL